MCGLLLCDGWAFRGDGWFVLLGNRQGYHLMGDYYLLMVLWISDWLVCSAT
jgi:hypothetical protein